MTVGVMGSAGGYLPETVCEPVRRLGVAVAKRGYVLVTGACPGLPQEAVKGAKAGGGTVVGVSPALNLEEHVRKYHSPTRGYDAIIYTGSGLMGREIENIRSCDVVVFAGGRSGTLGEFAIAYDEGKVIGVLEGTGGITQHLKQIIGMVEKKTGAVICYDADPERLLDQLERVYQQHVLPRHVRALEGHDPDGVPEPEGVSHEHP
ncbi:MAG: LOG family protein [Chloroflexi bacterium]|nr:LOG family protein [Chloroflexota bacterium]